jgi:hypothetical protein
LAFAANVNTESQNSTASVSFAFPLDRVYAGKSFVVEQGWTEGDAGGNLRVTFKRLH